MACRNSQDIHPNWLEMGLIDEIITIQTPSKEKLKSMDDDLKLALPHLVPEEEDIADDKLKWRDF